MSIFASSINSLVLGDLYSLQQEIYENRIGSDRFYFKLEEGSFQRPSFFIKLVDSSLAPFHKSFRKVESQVMVQYFTEDYYDAQVVANELQMLLSGGPYFPDLVLPRYDFTTKPPTKAEVSGWDRDNTFVGGARMGARIDPASINNGGIIQEENRAWNVPITFTMVSPMPTFQCFPVMEEITVDFLSGTPVLPYIPIVTVRGLPSIDVTVI